jgi:glutamate synthase (NADPH/NADH) large chain
MGANRVGFATMAMVALGCTACRGCQLDTCHVGIATQVETQQEATHKGMKRFVPREFESAVDALCRLFVGIGDEVRALTARLGFTRTQDMVGRVDLLYQARAQALVDVAALLDPASPALSTRELQLGCGATCLPARPPRSHLSRQLAAQAVDRVTAGAARVQLSHERALSDERVIGTYLSGAMVRERVLGVSDDRPAQYPEFEEAHLVLNEGSVPGNGLAAFHVPKLHISVHGGAQDGLAKCAAGGQVAILKARGHQSERWIDGSVGKSFAYGAQHGLFIVQGDADSRAGIRLSGADLILGGEIEQPLDDSRGALATRANIKGFAFEYMTMGRAIVLGDPGPWICSGMTGGVVYLRLQPELGFDEAAIRRRIAKGAKVALAPLDEQDAAGVVGLLEAYRLELEAGGQVENAARVAVVQAGCRNTFVKIVPQNQQVDASISTE